MSRALRQETLADARQTYVWFRHVGSLRGLQRVWCKCDGLLGRQKDCYVVYWAARLGNLFQLSIELCWGVVPGVNGDPPGKV